MDRNSKIFIAVFVISLPVWWSFNLGEEKLEEFLFWKIMADNPQILMAQMIQEEQLAKLKPIRKAKEEPGLELEAEAVISVFLNEGGTERIIFEKNSNRALPLASLTKLMTAYVALEHYSLSEVQIRNIIYPLLIASDNGSANNLVGLAGDEKTFVELMNSEAKNLGMSNTFFANATGLDPIDGNQPLNYSTVQDLVKLAKQISKKQPLIWEISILQEYEHLLNTNELLKEFPQILGGKTGLTLEAKGCLLIILESPRGRGKIMNVVLSSPDRFGDMRKLIDWAYSAHQW